MVKFRSLSLPVLVAASFLGISSCSSSTTELKADGDRKMAPDFTLKDAKGATVKLSDFRGKVVLLNFWATWCGPCKVEIPWFISFQQDYRDKDLVVLGVSFDDEGWDVINPYVEEKKINYRILLGDDEVSEAYGGVEALPTTYIIDREGRIASDHVGLVAKKTYEDEILGLLNAKSAAAPAARDEVAWAR